MIHHTLEKDNGKVDKLSRKSNYIETREIFSYSNFKVNKNGSLSANKYKLVIKICIIKDDQELFKKEKKRLYIFEDQINEIIKEQYNRLLQSHFSISKMLQFL